MGSDALYSSPHATVRRQDIEILGQSYALESVEEVTHFDSRPKAIRWTIVGAVALGIMLITSEMKSGRGGYDAYVVATFVSAIAGLLSVAFVLGGIALILYTVNPRLGAGLVVTKVDGTSDIIKGLTRSEIAEVQSAIAKARSTATSG